MAYRRRSPALALIAVGFAAQWIPWARIDRAAFQYHYYTALPFVDPRPRLPRRGAVARRRRDGRGCGSASRRPRRSSAPAAMWLFVPAALRARRRDDRQPGLAGLSGGHPRRRPDDPDARPHRPRRRRRPSCCGRGSCGCRRGGRDDRSGAGAALDSARRQRGRGRLGIVVASALPDTALLTWRGSRSNPSRCSSLLPLAVSRRTGPRRARRAALRRSGLGVAVLALVRDLVPEHLRAAVAVDRRERLPGPPADLPVRLPVPRQHRRLDRRRRCSAPSRSP